MITSPGFPQYYPHGINYTWTIQLSIGQLIQFKFLHFDVQSSAHCIWWDSLRIYDGVSSTSPMLGRYCGDSLPPSQISSSNHLFIYFYSDNSGSGTGFKLEYNATSKNPFEIDSCTFYVYSWENNSPCIWLPHQISPINQFSMQNSKLTNSYA